jgi:Tfp pilus assembly protein PilF
MMRKSLAVCLLALASVATSAFAVEEVRVLGKITDTVTKKPIPDAVVTVSSTESINFKSDFPVKKDGTFAFLLLKGTIKYKFAVNAPGYAPYEETGVKFTIGTPNVKDIELTPPSAAAAAPSGKAAETTKADPAVAAFNEGAGLANDGKDAEALAKFDEAVAANEKLTRGWEARAKMAIRTKNWAKAIESANKALELGGDEEDMNAILYDAYSSSGDKAKAAEMKKKLPANASGLYNDAVKFLNAGKDKDAEPLLKQAIAADEKFAMAYFQLGMIYARTSQNADARTNLQKYIELDPKGPEAATAKEMLNYLK